MSRDAPARVGIDAYNLMLEDGTGVATYARNLALAVHGLGAEPDILYGRPLGKSRDPLLREIAFFDPPVRKANPGLDFVRHLGRLGEARGGGLAAREISLSGRVIRADFTSRLPQFDRLWNIDDLFGFSSAYFDLFADRMTVRLPQPPQVMHWTYPLPIKLEGSKNIYTLHDLVPLRLPHTTLDRKRRYLRLMRLLARDADHILTVSEASKRDIVDILGVPEERVTNTYQAVDLPAAVTGRSEDEVRDEVEGVFGLTYKRYFLFFGAIEPKKNVNRLIQGYLNARVTDPLVLVGKRAWKADQEMRLFDLQKLRPRAAGVPSPTQVLHIDYLPLPMLMSLVRGAKAVVFPSLYEGFGLPVLEAMQLGTPVITADAASLPEIAGDAALLVDPYDPRTLSEAIRVLDSDPGLCAELSARGLRQANRFSPEAYRERLARLYQDLGVRL